MPHRKIIGSVLGELEHDVLWFRSETMPLWGTEYPVAMFVNCYSNQTIIPEQQQAYLVFKENIHRLTTEFENEIFLYQQSVYEEYRDRLRELADESAPIIHSKEELKALVVPNSFSIEHTSGKRTIDFCFSTKWDPEFDVGIQCVDEQITIVGTHTDIL